MRFMNIDPKVCRVACVMRPGVLVGILGGEEVSQALSKRLSQYIRLINVDIVLLTFLESKILCWQEIMVVLQIEKNESLKQTGSV